MWSNPAHALDAAKNIGLHIEHHRHGASDVRCWVQRLAVL
jgi:hypothetical protein